MRSIPAATTWELLARGKWVLPAATLGAIAFPAMILTALQNEGPLAPRDPSMLAMHIMMIQLNIIFFVAAILGGQERASRLYACPLTTSGIVACRLLPAMVVVALQMLVATASVNLLFELGWPYWGPALFAAVVSAAFLAVNWLTERSPGWLIASVAVLGAIFGLWLKARYGPTFSQPVHPWETLTAAEVFTLISLGAAGYWFAVVGVARNRRGEPPISLGVMDWLWRQLPARRAASPRLATPLQAHLWFGWQSKGWFMPAAVVALVAVGSVIVPLAAIYDAEDALGALIAISSLLVPIAVLGGMMLGNLGPSDSNFAMGHFLATRPSSDAEMASAVLRTVARSVLLAWGIWAAAFFTAYLLLRTADSRVANVLEPWDWWKLPGVLLAMWIAASTFTSLVLIGRSRQTFAALCTLIAMVMGVMVLSKIAFSPNVQLFLWRAMVVGFTAAMIAAPAWCFATALRRSLVDWRLSLAAIGLWGIATLALTLGWPFREQPSVLGYLFLVGVLALAVAPLAAAPLAISWNRHR